MRTCEILGKESRLFSLLCTSDPFIHVFCPQNLLCIRSSLAQPIHLLHFAISRILWPVLNASKLQTFVVVVPSIWCECVRPCVFIDFSLVYILVVLRTTANYSSAEQISIDLQCNSSRQFYERNLKLDSSLILQNILVNNHCNN